MDCNGTVFVMYFIYSFVSALNRNYNIYMVMSDMLFLNT